MSLAHVTCSDESLLPPRLTWRTGRVGNTSRSHLHQQRNVNKTQNTNNFKAHIKLFRQKCHNQLLRRQNWNHREDYIMRGFVSVDRKPMCLECGAILTNDSMKKVKLEHHQKSKHPSSVGKEREYFEYKKNRQPVKLSDFIQKMNTAKAKTLKSSYLVSDIIA